MNPEQQTPKEQTWYVVEFAGFFNLHNEPFYEGKNVLDAEHVGYETAKANAELAKSAPDLKRERDELQKQNGELVSSLRRIAEFISDKEYSAEYTLTEVLEIAQSVLNKYSK